MDTTRIRFKVKFAEVTAYWAKLVAKFAGHQNCAVNMHREGKPSSSFA